MHQGGHCRVGPNVTLQHHTTPDRVITPYPDVAGPLLESTLLSPPRGGTTCGGLDTPPQHSMSRGLGLQQIVEGGSAILELIQCVHRRKVAQTTSLSSGHGGIGQGTLAMRRSRPAAATWWFD